MSCFPLCAVPASPPLNVIASVLSSTEIQMNWTEIPEMEQNGIIIEYEVMYEPLMTFNGVLASMAYLLQDQSTLQTFL